MPSSTLSLTAATWTKAATASGADADVTISSRAPIVWAITAADSAPSLEMYEGTPVRKIAHQEWWRESLRIADGEYLWVAPVEKVADLTVVKPTGA